MLIHLSRSTRVFTKEASAGLPLSPTLLSKVRTVLPPNHPAVLARAARTAEGVMPEARQFLKTKSLREGAQEAVSRAHLLEEPALPRAIQKTQVQRPASRVTAAHAGPAMPEAALLEKTKIRAEAPPVHTAPATDPNRVSIGQYAIPAAVGTGVGVGMSSLADDDVKQAGLVGSALKGAVGLGKAMVKTPLRRAALATGGLTAGMGVHGAMEGAKAGKVFSPSSPFKPMGPSGGAF